MIRRRPPTHQELAHYRGLPDPPFRIDLEKIPAQVRTLLFPLRHVEPLGIDVLQTVGATIGDTPREEEFAFYEEQRSQFQLIFVVVNCIFGYAEEGANVLFPYSVSLIPASKRGEIEASTARFVRAMTSGAMLQEQTAYLGLDPFKGDWSFWSTFQTITELQTGKTYTDELGLVHDYFYLRTDVDLAQIAQPIIGVEGGRFHQYFRHRAKLLYRPFQRLESRRVWGVENAMELFLLQEMHRRGLPFPTIQCRVYTDAIHPTLYDAWAVWDDDKDQRFISEVDFLFEDKKLVVFCDGNQHRRIKNVMRDKAINQRLESAGYTVLRLPSQTVLEDVESAADQVAKLL